MRRRDGQPLPRSPVRRTARLQRTYRRPDCETRNSAQGICDCLVRRPLQKLMQNFFISANPFVQLAGIAALTQTGPEIEAMRTAYDTRRRFLLAGLAKLGFRLPVKPTGAFYVFVNARHLSEDSYALAFDILEKVKVGVTPGIDFGPGGEGFLRFSYAKSMENLAEALNRLETYLAGR